MNGKTQYGIVVGAYVDDYLNGVIKKHELTRRDKEEDRMKHVRICDANMEPVFFAYPDNQTLDALLTRYAATKPEYDFIAPSCGLCLTLQTSRPSRPSLPRCRAFTLPTATIVQLQQRL